MNRTQNYRGLLPSFIHKEGDYSPHPYTRRPITLVRILPGDLCLDLTGL